MERRKCVVCGKEYMPKKASQKVCGKECRAELKRRNACKYYEKFNEKRRQQRLLERKTYEITCIMCGKTFYSLCAHTKCCSEECQHARMLELYKKNHERYKAEREKENEKRQHELELKERAKAMRKQCASCKYSTYIDHDIACYYIVMEGHSRGCDPVNCECYKKRRKRRRNTTGKDNA